MSKGIHEATHAFSRLSLPAELNLGDVVEFASERRGRPILVRTLTSLAGTATCGLWLSTEGTEYVFHAPSESVLHRRQIILHELSHMILGHGIETDIGPGTITELFPDLDPTSVKRVLARTSFRTRTTWPMSSSSRTTQEAAAEHMADLFAAALRRSASRSAKLEQLFG